jgi:arylformamidase
MVKLIDISMEISEGLRTNSSKPGEEARFSYDMTPDTDPHGRTIRRINARLHTGTHIDSAEHIKRGAKRLDQYPVDTFMGDALVVDMTHKVPGGEITAHDLDNAAGDKIKAGDILIVRTGWSKHYADENYFTDSPYLTHDAALWCIDKQVKMVAVDFLMDKRGHTGPGSKRPILEAGILNLTNVDNLDSIDQERVTLVAFPLKIVPSEAGLTRAVVIEG